MSSNRRDVLSILGLGSVAAPAVAFATPTTVDMTPSEGGNYHFGRSNPKRSAAALRALADAIEGGGVNLIEVEIKSKVAADTWLHHELHVQFIALERHEG